MSARWRRPTVGEPARLGRGTAYPFSPRPPRRRGRSTGNARRIGRPCPVRHSGSSPEMAGFSRRAGRHGALRRRARLVAGVSPRPRISDRCVPAGGPACRPCVRACLRGDRSRRHAARVALVRKREPERRSRSHPPPASHCPTTTRRCRAGAGREPEPGARAARVVEDYCRFVLNDRVLTAEVKSLRHGLAAAASRVPAAWLLGSRDTPGDVGTGVTAGSEYERSSAAGVAAANLKRLQESLRSLEEFGKLIGPDLGRELETLRYRAYTLESAIVGRGRGGRDGRGGRGAGAIGPGLCHPHRVAVRGPLEETIAAAAEGGVGIIQLREKGPPGSRTACAGTRCAAMDASRRRSLHRKRPARHCPPRGCRWRSPRSG